MKYIVDPDGNYTGGFEGVDIPGDWIEISVSNLPPHGRCRFVDGTWLDMRLYEEERQDAYMKTWAFLVTSSTRTTKVS